MELTYVWIGMAVAAAVALIALRMKVSALEATVEKNRELADRWDDMRAEHIMELRSNLVALAAALGMEHKPPVKEPAGWVKKGGE